MNKLFQKNMTSMTASAPDACFAAAVCLIMMGTISVVSIILLIGVLLLGVDVISVICKSSRKSTMAANA